MKLIELLAQELPKRGGWPNGSEHAWCDPDGEIRFRNGGCKPDFYPESEVDIQCRVPDFSYENDPLYIVTREQYEAALAAAQQPVWSGEGVPPVGCECEMYDSESGWEVVYIKYVGNKTVVLDVLGGDEYSFELSTCTFRPIRSESDKRRDEVIESLEYYVGKEDATDLYAAIAMGNIEGVKLDV